MKILTIYIRLVDRLNSVIGHLVSVLLPAMVVVLSYEVIARYVFDRPTLWAYDVAIFMFGYAGLLAGGHVLTSRDHVNVDIVYDRLNLRQRAVMDSITGLIFFFFMILVVIYTFKTAAMAFEMHERTATAWGPPVAHYKLMIPIGGFLLLLQGSANWIRSLYRAIHDKELEA